MNDKSMGNEGSAQGESPGAVYLKNNLFQVLTLLLVIAGFAGLMYAARDDKAPTVMMDIDWQDIASEGQEHEQELETILTIRPHVFLDTSTSKTSPSEAFKQNAVTNATRAGVSSRPTGRILITPVFRVPRTLETVPTFSIAPISKTVAIINGVGEEASFWMYIKSNDKIKDVFDLSLTYKDYLDAVVGKVAIQEGDSFKTSSYSFSPGEKPIATCLNIDIFTWAKIFLAVFIALNLIAFTGEPRPRKIRFLFFLMYLTSILAMVVPISIVILLHYYPGLVSNMQMAVIGLVQGTTAGIPDVQWLLNIGGNVYNSISDPTYSNIKGGVVVPFYVVWLATIGAGIRMTMQVPDIQKNYVTLRDTEEPNDSNEIMYITSELNRNGAKARRELIRNFMFLLSAPFLGIATYYLLQVTGTSVSKEVMVIMAFFAGLKSDFVIHYISLIGVSTIKRKKDENKTDKDV